jgi:hypothetical protein
MEVLAQQKGQPISQRWVAEHSGGLITHGTVNTILNPHLRRVNELRDSTLRGIATALEIDPKELWDVAQNRKSAEGDIYADIFTKFTVSLEMTPTEKQRLEHDAKRCNRHLPDHISALIREYLSPGITGIEGLPDLEPDVVIVHEKRKRK